MSPFSLLIFDNVYNQFSNDRLALSFRRSNFQIAVDVLSVINRGESRPTRIMYAATLSWPSLQKTLDLLVSKGYAIELSDKSKDRKKHYIITNTGRNVLNYYDRLEKLIKSDIPKI
jgi:predicted transcriptional regulator